jgi:hypothetical protein
VARFGAFEATTDLATGLPTGLGASQAWEGVPEQLQLRANHHADCTTNIADVGITVLHDGVVCCITAAVRGACASLQDQR